MRLVFRGLFGVTIVLLVLAVLGTATVYYLASKSLPTYEKSLSVANLTAPLDIVRDNVNIPLGPTSMTCISASDMRTPKTGFGK